MKQSLICNMQHSLYCLQKSYCAMIETKIATNKVISANAVSPRLNNACTNKHWHYVRIWRHFLASLSLLEEMQWVDSHEVHATEGKHVKSVFLAEWPLLQRIKWSPGKQRSLGWCGPAHNSAWACYRWRRPKGHLLGGITCWGHGYRWTRRNPDEWIL